MPPRDPRERPALEEALPADDIASGTWRPDGSPLEVQFGDQSWRLVTVARWEDRHGREVIQVEWHAAGTTWEGAYLADGERMREG